MKPFTGNLINRMHPLQRILISLVFCACVFFSIPKQEISDLMVIMIVWIAFALSYTTMNIIILFNRTVNQIKETATSDDGSAGFVFIMILLASFASVFTVLLLMISTNNQSHHKALFMIISIFGMVISWVMIHSVFTFHYAHMYYNDDKNAARGLNFPEDDTPDYLDFTYFSFVIGCTFQVSDVEITSKNIRRLVLLHGLLSFALNTFVVALTINLIAGISH